MFDQFPSFLVIRTDLDMLSDVVIGGQIHRTNVDLNEIFLEVGSESLYFFGPSGGEEEGLSVGSDLTDDLSDLRFETCEVEKQTLSAECLKAGSMRSQLTHIQHPIGFIHHQISYPLQIGLSTLQHINQPSRRSHHDLGTTLQISNLLSFGYSTIDGGVSDLGGTTEFGTFGLGLNGEFSSGSEDEDDGSVPGSEEGLTEDEKEV